MYPTPKIMTNYNSASVGHKIQDNRNAEDEDLLYDSASYRLGLISLYESSAEFPIPL